METACFPSTIDGSHNILLSIEFTGIIATKYTIEGNLLGHLTIGANLVDEAALKLNIKSEVPMLLKHMLLSHHGKHEFGAAVLPQTKEALLLSYIDDIDSKMIMVEKALKVTNEGELTDKIFALDNRAFYNPKKN